MTRPRFSFRPNLQKEDHRKAWEALQAVPEGQKNSFLVKSILEQQERGELENILRRVIREELKTIPSQLELSREEVIPQEMMGFLDSLLNE